MVPPQWRARHKGGGREPHDPACPLVAGAPAEAEGCLGCGSLLPSPLCASHPGPCLRVLEACHAACLGQGHPPLTPPPTQHGTQSLCLEHVRSVRAGRAASMLHPGPRAAAGPGEGAAAATLRCRASHQLHQPDGGQVSGSGPTPCCLAPVVPRKSCIWGMPLIEVQVLMRQTLSHPTCVDKFIPSVLLKDDHRIWACLLT